MGQNRPKQGGATLARGGLAAAVARSTTREKAAVYFQRERLRTTRKKSIIK